MRRLLKFLLLAFLISCKPSSEQGEETLSGSETALTSTEGLYLDSLILPEGYGIQVFARAKNARSMSISPNGTLFVGTMGEGKVYAIQDEDGDMQADTLYLLAEGLRNPNGVAFRNGDLYVAEISKLWKFPDIENHLGNPEKELIYDDFPTDGHHGWKYIAFGPDDKLYVPVGAPCNICESKNEIYASITRMNPDGSGREVFAKGIRNTVGFTWHPETNVMYFTDNGRDWMGDDQPSCELNRVTEPGQHFGFPYCHAGDVPDPEFGSQFPCSEFIPPVAKLGPHVAPLGIKFCTSDHFPGYKGKIFIAEHGSWNRSPEAGHTGHIVEVVTEQNGEDVGQETFIEGFLSKQTNQAWGRPVDLLFLADGSMLLSDDRSGTIYRISYDAE